MVQVGGDVSVSIAEQRRQVHALHALASALDAAVAGSDTAVAGSDTAVAGSDTAVAGSDAAVASREPGPAGGGLAEGLVLKIYHPESDALRGLRLLDPALSASLCSPSKVPPPPPSSIPSPPSLTDVAFSKVNLLICSVLLDVCTWLGQKNSSRCGEICLVNIKFSPQICPL